MEEFFQLFKTPWEQHKAGGSYDVIIATRDDVQLKDCDAHLVLLFTSRLQPADRALGLETGVKNHAKNAAGLRICTQGAEIPLYGPAQTFSTHLAATECLKSTHGPIALLFQLDGQKIARVGYDLFAEVKYLLEIGQPVSNAAIPALELHIETVRTWMIDAGLTFVEIPPIPNGFEFAACLTHDIDFVGIRKHKFDHTLAGFLYRSTITSAGDFLRGKISWRRLLKIWKAVASLPLVHLGVMEDFWMPFDWYLKVEKGLNPTYFLLPFKGVPGRNVSSPNPERRASPYEPAEIREWIARLREENCEIGVHGIDAWHDAESGRAELEKIRAETGAENAGIRMHWLLREANTNRVLEAAGYAYDSTIGYNETVGYRAGTSQVFRPLDVKRLLELPMHIQDGALFYGKRLALSEAEAWGLCEKIIENARKLGGVTTILWHDRSHGPERFWGDFYVKLVGHLKTLPVWFASAERIVNWFNHRRAVTFEKDENYDREGMRLTSNGQAIEPALRVRVYNPPKQQTPSVEFPWDGRVALNLSDFLLKNQPAALHQPA